MVLPPLPPEWQPILAALTPWLHARLAWRLPPLLIGVLFARGRRTVTSWLRGAGIAIGFPGYYYFLARLGGRTGMLAGILLRTLVTRLAPGDRLLFALDDTPTKRYGRKVQGAGIHHNPTPGPTDQQFLYGHLWVCLSWVLRHPLWGSIGLPLLARLYVRACDIGKLPKQYGWTFRTKLDLAAAMVVWLTDWLRLLGKTVWLVVDGGYAKKPFLKAALQAGAVVVGRLRKDAALRTVPPPRQRGPGRPRKYGAQRISLAKRAGQQRGWQTVTATQYGRQVAKKLKTFVATWEPVGGAIRVVLVRETTGWVAFFCTDPQAPVEAILEAVADRSAIEQNFHDLKEVEGVGQQQVRNIWANIGALHLSMWVHTLIEWWAWEQPKEAICDRRMAPWDDAERRPSHADRRKALQRRCLDQEFFGGKHRRRLTGKIRELLRQVIRMVG